MRTATGPPSYVLTLVALGAMMIGFGCDELNQMQSEKPKTSAPSPKENKGAVHRFVLTKTDGGVAFDTQTGQICRTWDWQPGGKPEKADPNTGWTPQRAFGEFAPTCISLYEKYPSRTSPQTEAISDDN